MSLEDGNWIRPLSKFEEFLEVAHQHGFLITCYCLTLNSKLPLQEYHIKRSLLHLLRKLPSLRVNIRTKEGVMWFYKAENENIDFQILPNADFQKEYEAMTVHHYDSYKGPLWCTRLLPLSPDEVCAMPEIKEKFTHQYKLLFGFHHSITDGTSSIKVCSFFMDILNDVIAGKPINDVEQWAEHVTDEQTLKVVGEVSNNIQNNPTELKRYVDILQGNVNDILFLKVYPPPENVRAKTLNIAHSLSREETSTFLKRCKDEGVTIHSGFCSVVNTAIVEMLTKGGLNDEKFKIKHYHAVNNRRYWKGDTSKTFGAHLGKITMVSEVSTDINDFWNQARTYHNDFQELLNEKGPIKEMIAMFMNLPQKSEKSNMTEDMSMGDLYYATTNMGNLANTLRGEGEHVQVTDFRRTTSTTKNLGSHVMQTFRGRFLYGLDYEAALMTKQTAQLYVDTIFDVLKRVIEL